MRRGNRFNSRSQAAASVQGIMSIAMTAKEHFLDASRVHYEWNNALPPRLTIDAGDTVVFETRDASDEFFTARSTHEDVMRRVFKGHPLTGPRSEERRVGKEWRGRGSAEVRR